jgi:acyl carrier protein
LEGNLETSIRRFIIDSFLFGEDASLKPDTSFIENGIIDSTGVLELITFIEENYGIRVEDHEIVPENLDSIRRVVDFLSRKLGERTTAGCAALN